MFVGRPHRSGDKCSYVIHTNSPDLDFQTPVKEGGGVRVRSEHLGTPGGLEWLECSIFNYHCG